MNKIYKLSAQSATAALVGMNAAIAVNPGDWPVGHSVYSYRNNVSTYSDYRHSARVSVPAAQEFANRIAELFEEFGKNQETLEAELQEIYFKFSDQLYEA